MGDGGKIRTAPHIQLVTDAQSTFRDAFKLSRAEVRNDGFPLPDRSGADPQRPRDIRGVLKVINNVLFEHKNPFTTVKEFLQPQCQEDVLTSVAMDKLATISERLSASMANAEVSASELARACDVSPAAVHKWLNGGKMSADNSAAAARSLGVREEWLRTGRLPRDRANGAQEESIDAVVDILQGLREPLAALALAIDKLGKIKEEPAKKARKRV